MNLNKSAKAFEANGIKVIELSYRESADGNTKELICKFEINGKEDSHAVTFSEKLAENFDRCQDIFVARTIEYIKNYDAIIKGFEKDER